MNQNYDPGSYYGYQNPQTYEAPKAPPRKFNTYESVFGWLSFLFGYLFCRCYTFTLRPLGAFLFTLILTIVTGALILIQQKKMPLLS